MVSPETGTLRDCIIADNKISGVTVGVQLGPVVADARLVKNILISRNNILCSHGTLTQSRCIWTFNLKDSKVDWNTLIGGGMEAEFFCNAVNPYGYVENDTFNVEFCNNVCASGISLGDNIHHNEWDGSLAGKRGPQAGWPVAGVEMFQFAKVHHNHFKNLAESAAWIYATHAGGGQISHNTFEGYYNVATGYGTIFSLGYWDAGVGTGDLFLTPNYLTIESNIFENVDQGINFAVGLGTPDTVAKGIKILNNTFRHLKREAMTLNRLQNSKISGNTIADCYYDKAGAGAYNALYFTDSFINNEIVDNDIYRTGANGPSNGIYITGALSVNNRIAGNRSTVLAGQNDYSIVAGNFVENNNYASGIIYGVIPSLANDATPSLLSGYPQGKWRTGGTTTITDLDDGHEGQIVTIIAEHSVTITDGTNIFLCGSADVGVAASGRLTLLQKSDGNWYEIGRSDN